MFTTRGNFRISAAANGSANDVVGFGIVGDRALHSGQAHGHAMLTTVVIDKKCRLQTTKNVDSARGVAAVGD
jgi:hypothetical protein